MQATYLPSHAPFLTAPLGWSCHPSSSSVGKYPNIAYPKSIQFCLQYYKDNMKRIDRKMYFFWIVPRRNKRSQKPPCIKVPLTDTPSAGGCQLALHLGMAAKETACQGGLEMNLVSNRGIGVYWTVKKIKCY